MGTTADKLNAILNTKEAIKQAIRDKGVYIGDYDAFADYPDAIRSIETSSGEGGSDEFFNLRTQNGTDFSNLFFSYTGSELDLSGWDTSNVTTMNNMFIYNYSLTSLNLSNWDTGNVSDMTNMFNSCSSLSSLDLSGFNTSNVVDMSYIFNGCTGLASLNLNNWDTRNVTSMNNMFNSCGNLTALDLNNFDTSKVNNMNSMFSNCNNLRELNISSFNTSQVTDMNCMFSYCYGLKSLDLSHFNTSNVTNIDSMFSWCNNLEELDIRNFNVNNNIEYVNYMFEGCYVLHKLRLDNCGYDTINKIINSVNFPTGQVYVDGEYINRKMYVQEANATGLTPPNNWEFVYVDSDGNEIVPEPEIYQVGYYKDNSEITEATTMVNNTHTDLREMFQYCNNLTTINGIEQWDTSNVIDMNRMFDGCNNLTSLDLSSFITGNVTNMEYMFADCNNLKTLDIRNFDMSKVENTNDMFGGCDELKVLRLDNWDYKNIGGIINDTSLPTGDIDFELKLMYVQEANIINPDNQDERLTAPDGWKFVYVAGNPQDTYDEDSKPFKEDRDIQEVNVAVTKKHIDLSRMFERCENLEIIHNIDTWDTSNVRIMNDMFNTCYKLIYLDLSSWNIDRIDNMSSMFERCDNLIYLDIRNFNISYYTEIRDMFSDCHRLQVLRLDNCDDSIIKRIINDTNLPTGDIDGRLRKMYIQEKYATNPEEYGLTAPDGWEFAYVEAKKE